MAKKKKKFKEGQLCPKECGGDLYLQQSRYKPSKEHKKYFYTAFFRCDECNAFFMDERFRVYYPEKKFKTSDFGELMQWIIANRFETDIMDQINKMTFPFTSKYKEWLDENEKTSVGKRSQNVCEHNDEFDCEITF